MNNLKHPSELNPYLCYQQVRKIAKRTSRSKNPDWYEEAFAIQRQWHIWVDGEEVLSCLFDQKAQRWLDGPTLSWLDRKKGGDDVSDESAGLNEVVAGRPFNQEDREELHSALAEVLRSRELGGKVGSLGVVFHVADEFAILDPAREYSSNRNFEEVQSLLQVDPKEVLGDSTIEPLLSTWRLMPFWGVKEGRMNMAVQLGRDKEAFFSAVREYGEDNNVAIVATGLSAPLEALRLAPLYLDWQHGEDKGDIVLMMYRSFSALAVLNGSGELVQLRALGHRAGLEYPSGLGDILLNTQTSVGMDNPVVSIIPMSTGNGKEQLTAELTSFFARRTPMDIGFSDLDQMDFLQEVPKHRIEMLVGGGAGLDVLLEDKALMENDTFTGLGSGWAMQNFYPIADAEEEKFPTWQELQMRKWFTIVKVILLLGVVGMTLWGGVKVMKVIGTDAWNTADQSSALANSGMAKLQGEKGELDHWQSVMRGRSGGGLVMQLLLDLFPENSGIVITNLEYSVKGASTGRAKGAPAGAVAKNKGYARDWSFTGYVSPAGLAHLTKLGGIDFMKSQFESFAEKYDASEYSMVPKGRVMSVTLQRERQNYPSTGMLSKEEGAAYTTSFTLKIGQRISAEDELAVPIKMTVPAKPGVPGRRVVPGRPTK